MLEDFHSTNWKTLADETSDSLADVAIAILQLLEERKSIEDLLKVEKKVLKGMVMKVEKMILEKTR